MPIGHWITSRRWFSIVGSALWIVTAILATAARADGLPGSSMPTVFAVSQGELVGCRDYVDYIAEQNPGAHFDIEPLERIGDYELLPYEPRIEVSRPPGTGADDLDRDMPPSGYIVFSSREDFQLIAPLLSQFEESQVPWESLFIWSPPTSFNTPPDHASLMLLDRDRMTPAAMPSPEPASAVLLSLAAGIVGLPAVRRLRTRLPGAICLVAAAVLIPLTASTTHAGTIDTVPWRIVVDENPPAEFVAPALNDWETTYTAEYKTLVLTTTPLVGDHGIAIDNLVGDETVLWLLFHSNSGEDIPDHSLVLDWRVDFSGVRPVRPFPFDIANADVPELESVARDFWTEGIGSSGWMAAS